MAQGVKRTTRDISDFHSSEHGEVLNSHLNAISRFRLLEVLTARSVGWKERARAVQACTVQLRRFETALLKLHRLIEKPTRSDQGTLRRRRLLAFLRRLDDAALSKWCARYNVDKASFGTDHTMLLEALADEVEA